MFCKQCGYRLWNLPSRACPECGTPFRVSDFDFTLNSVEFRCPHCAQGYYGTGARGHLIPPEFDCVRCRNHIHMDQMILLPTAGVEEERTQTDTMPWLDRNQRGLLKRWWATVKMALAKPSRLIELTPEAGTTWSALRFAVLTNAIVYLVFAVPIMTFSLLMAGAFGGPGGGALEALTTMGAIAMFGMAFVLSLILIGGAISHAILRLTGPTQAGLPRTYQAFGFASGANVISAIPCAGGYIGWIWWLVSAVLMVRSGQKVSGGRASLAVLTLPVLLLVGLIGLGFWVAYAASSFASAAVYTGSSAPSGSTTAVYDALRAFASDHDGVGPRHAVELLAGDYPVTGSDLVEFASLQNLAAFPVGATTLAALEDLPPLRKDKAVADAIAALPGNVIAHRLGDSVFTYHGINFDDNVSQLWVLVRLPPVTVSTASGPAAAALSPGQTYFVVRADGSGQWADASTMPNMLAMQNRVRARHKLAPLPDPATVTADKPAAATFDPTQPPPADDESSDED